MHTDIIWSFRRYFESLEVEKIPMLQEMYDEEVVFQDPIHSIQGLPNLIAYFQKLNEAISTGGFIFTEQRIAQDKAFLAWDMQIELKKTGKKVHASGISVLTIHDKIIAQRDYFDAGEVFYEPVPVIGSIIRFMKKQIAS